MKYLKSKAGEPGKMVLGAGPAEDARGGITVLYIGAAQGPG